MYQKALLQQINTFQEEDPILHQNDSGRPRSLYFGNDLEIGQQINRTNLERVKKDQESIQQQEEIPVEDTKDIKLLQSYLKRVQISSKQIFNYNRNFENENDIFSTQSDPKQIEAFSDYVQCELEKMNSCDGFELIVDCETKYGSIGLSVIDMLNDIQGSKTAKFMIALLDSGKSRNRIINKVLTLTQYQQYTNVLVPLEMRNMQMYIGYPDLNQQLSFLINNIVSPYKCHEDHVSMYDFCQRITPAPQNNIFNVLARVPTLIDKPDDSILNFKKQNLQTLRSMQFQQPIIKFSEKYESFGESYFLRGLSPLPNERNLKSYGIDIRLIDYVYLMPNTYESDDKTLPYHSGLFSNECYKHSLQVLCNDFNELGKPAFLQYEKSSLDDLIDVRHALPQLIENYGGIDEDDVQQQ